MFDKKITKGVIDYLIISIGVFLYTFSWIAFIIPKGISGGGLTGISTIIYFATGIPISYSYLGINVFLIGIGSFILGKGFGFKTIYSILLSTVMFEVLPQIPWIVELSDIPEKFINSIIGGTISAFGIAAIFIKGGSTGGTDIIAIVLSKYKDTSPGKIFMYCDLLIIGSAILLPGKGLQDVVYGYMQMISFTYMLDMILTGEKQSVQILIFSSKYEQVGDMLLAKMERGVTALNSVGWYTKQDSKVLVVVARKYQLPQLTAAIKEVDNNAFISVTSAMGVYGLGFEQVKAKPGGGKGGLRKIFKSSENN